MGKFSWDHLDLEELVDAVAHGWAARASHAVVHGA